MKYVKREKVDGIRAHQWDGSGQDAEYLASVVDQPCRIHFGHSRNNGPILVFEISSSETMQMKPGDYIIFRSDGKHERVGQKEFEDAYEPAVKDSPDRYLVPVTTVRTPSGPKWWHTGKFTV